MKKPVPDGKWKPITEVKEGDFIKWGRSMSPGAYPSIAIDLILGVQVGPETVEVKGKRYPVVSLFATRAMSDEKGVRIHRIRGNYQVEFVEISPRKHHAFYLGQAD